MVFVTLFISLADDGLIIGFVVFVSALLFTRVAHSFWCFNGAPDLYLPAHRTRVFNGVERAVGENGVVHITSQVSLLRRSQVLLFQHSLHSAVVLLRGGQ